MLLKELLPLLHAVNIINVYDHLYEDNQKTITIRADQDTYGYDFTSLAPYLDREVKLIGAGIVPSVDDPDWGQRLYDKKNELVWFAKSILEIELKD